jgi:hypothetical protein
MHLLKSHVLEAQAIYFGRSLKLQLIPSNPESGPIAVDERERPFSRRGAGRNIEKDSTTSTRGERSSTGHWGCPGDAEFFTRFEDAGDRRGPLLTT